MEAARQEWEQMEPEARTRRLMDDVPAFIKRRFETDAPELPLKRPRINASSVVQAMVGTTEPGPALQMNG